MKSVTSLIIALAVSTLGHASDAGSRTLVSLLQSDALAAHLVRTALRERALKMGAPEKDLGCMDTIKPADFTETAVRSISEETTPQQREELIAFLRKPGGENLVARLHAKVAGEPMPEPSQIELASMEAFMKTETGARLLSKDNNPFLTDALADRMAEVAKRTMYHCQQVMESRQP
jgi:hypothetical protein